jgi:hypothetical protein
MCSLLHPPQLAVRLRLDHVLALLHGLQRVPEPDALPELELTGVITEISDAFTQSGGDILYTVRIRVNETDSRLKWGMTVETIFRTGE